MALTRPFSSTVKARAARDPAFRVGLVEEAVDSLRESDLAIGKLLLRDYVDATRALARVIRAPAQTTNRVASD